MEWAVTLKGKTGPEGILMLLDEPAAAESIAIELRRRGHPVVVVPTASGDLAARRHLR